MGELLWLAGKAFLIALILTPIIRDISRSFNVVDRPGQRKVHAYPMPRVGGISIAIAYGLALFSVAGSGDSLSTAIHPAWKLIPGAAIVFLTGLIDDFFTLKPVFKLCGQVAGASVVFWSGLRMGGLADHPLSVWLDYPVTVFWLLLTCNALNLIDGLDGLCAGMGLLATLTLFAAAILHGNYPLAYVTLPLAGALLGFLCYNINPATVFLGDSGALLIGFLLGCYGMIWTQRASTLLSILVPLLALSIPLLDVSLSVLRRLLRHQPIFVADKGHIHHRLLDRGLSPRQAVWVLYLVAALAAAFALLAGSPIGGRYQGLIIVVFCGVALVGIRQLRYAEFDIAGRLLFRGEFQRAMDVRLRLTRAESALEQATTDEKWWEALAQSARTLELGAIRWTSERGTREERVMPGVAPAWSFRIPLSETDSVEVEGTLQAPSAVAFDLVGFAEMINRTFPGKRAPAGVPAAVVP
ncbi:MAG: undecaprenyl/decaprenyl-phosphate alpha-N-acetylglucosaminyl 1-phosphate transferase [Acidobacteriia bacterium]|nr:undecaprenyl/decaprenyl-phosphate alpha-N-acetylglucosaminyl 1-phosphate transferase [Terriglobia bacterium]